MLENKVIQEVRENNAHAGIDYMAFVDEMFRPEYKEKNVKIPDPVRRSLLRKSAGNRRFFDALVRLIWCECRFGCTAKSTSIDDWAEGSCKRAKKACFLSSAAEARQRQCCAVALNEITSSPDSKRSQVSATAKAKETHGLMLYNMKIK